MERVHVRHVLKDGTEVDDITGKVIKVEQFELLYQVISKINEKDQKNEAV